MADIPQSLMELSQVNFGLILDGRRNPIEYKSEWFAAPYDKGVEILLQPGATKEDVARVIVNTSYINDAHESVQRWNGIGESFDWNKALRVAHENYIMGIHLQRVGKKLEKNEPVDVLSLHAEIGSIISKESFGIQLLKDISSDYKPFKLSGYAPIDNTIGGIPSDGPIVILMTTGTGKSKLVTVIINSLLHKYPKDTGAVYTLEMSASHWRWRALNMFPSLKDVNDRLYVSGVVRDAEEIVAEAARKKFDYVVVDAINDLVKKDDAAEYEKEYKRLTEICRFMEIPVFITAQPNRETKKSLRSGERFPDLYDAAWSGAAENKAALFLTGITTNGLDMKSEEFPTTDRNLDYLIARKSRDGWPGDYDPTKQKGPGAIIMEHSSDWLGKPYGGKWRLWEPDSGGKAIGANKSKKKSED